MLSFHIYTRMQTPARTFFFYSRLNNISISAFLFTAVFGVIHVTDVSFLTPIEKWENKLATPA